MKVEKRQVEMQAKQAGSETGLLQKQLKILVKKRSFSWGNVCPTHFIRPGGLWGHKGGWDILIVYLNDNTQLNVKGVEVEVVRSPLRQTKQMICFTSKSKL